MERGKKVGRFVRIHGDQEAPLEEERQASGVSASEIIREGIDLALERRKRERDSSRRR